MPDKQALRSFLCRINYFIQSSDKTSILLSSKDLAVSHLTFVKLIVRFIPLQEPFFFSKESVTVRTSVLADDGDYPLPFSQLRE